jgi:hypothetical protein
MKTESKTSWLSGLLCLLLTLLAGRGLAAPGAVVPANAAQLQEFVGAIWIEGVPYHIASRIDPEFALPVLRKILADPQAAPQWANAAVTAGMIGHPDSADLLIEFITRAEPGKADLDQARAKTSAVMSLGYVVNKSGNEKALEFLRAGVNPKYWSSRKLPWSGALFADARQRDQQMATMAVLGLGLSGNAKAAEILRSFNARKTAPELDSAVTEALFTNEAVAREGLADYYRTRLKGMQLDPENTRAWENPPVQGEVLREARPGEVLKKTEPGEVIAQPRAGEVLRAPAAGTVLKQPPQ